MLDSPERWRPLDQMDMLGMVASMPTHLGDGNHQGRKVSLDASEYGGVAILGLGGSAIGGDLISSLVSDSSDIPVDVIRSYTVPRFVGPDTLAIAVSFSGDTEETLSMTEDALEKGATVAVVS